MNLWICVFLQLVPPLGMLNNPMNAVTTKFVRTSTNKVKCPVFVIRVRISATSGQLRPHLLSPQTEHPNCGMTNERNMHFWYARFSLRDLVLGVDMSFFYHGYWTLMYVALRVPPVFPQWTPEGRRLVTGASSGEFTLWNGLTFNFETILQVNMHLPSWLHHCDVSMRGFCVFVL